MTDPDTTLPLVTPDEIRAAVSGLSDETKYPDATLARFAERFVGRCTTYRGASPVLRSATETIQIGHTGRLLLAYPRVVAVTAISYDTGTAPATEDLTVRNGYEVINGTTAWPCGTWVTVTYAHGYTTPLPAHVDACIEFVRAEAIQQKGSQPRNVTGERTDLGWIPEPTADPSKGRPTKWTVVNEALNEVPDERLPGLA